MKHRPYVYFLKNPENGYIKIGSSTNLSLRFSAHRAMYGSRLIFMGVIEGTIHEEMLIHKIFSADRVGGYEWFNPNPILLDYINENAFMIDVPLYKKRTKSKNGNDYEVQL